MNFTSPVTVAGAGVMGLAAALRLARAGAPVVLCDPAASGDSASGVAAGMLAPAFETLLDPGGPDPKTLRAARDLWPDLLASIEAEHLLDRSGALLAALGDESDGLAGHAESLALAGFAADRLGADAVRALQPGLTPVIAGGLYTPDDWRLPPAETLQALRAAFLKAGGRIAPAALTLAGGGFRLGGEAVAGAVVLATGAGSRAFAAAAPELAWIQPIKGQILHFSAPPVDGPTIRGSAGYVVPQPSGVVVGATMEAGREDRDLDPETLAELRRTAVRLFPALADAPAQGRAGVRAAVADGLPLVGRSLGEACGEVVLCTAARRNGWLLAPLAAELVLQALAGGPQGAFDPSRLPGQPPAG